jgi:hypothetical protein
VNITRLEWIFAFSQAYPAYDEEGKIERIPNALKVVLPQVADDLGTIVVNGGSKGYGCRMHSPIN